MLEDGGVVEVNKIVWGRDMFETEHRSCRPVASCHEFPQTCPTLPSFMSPLKSEPLLILTDAKVACTNEHTWSVSGTGCCFRACAHNYVNKVLFSCHCFPPILRLLNAVSLQLLMLSAASVFEAGRFTGLLLYLAWRPVVNHA